MKNILVYILVLMCLVTACSNDSDDVPSTPSYDSGPNFWIFLCFGQSNMEGQGIIETQDLTVSDRFLCLSTTDGGTGRKLGKWRKAIPPLCRAENHLGPMDYFGRTLLDVVPETVTIGIVMVAIGGAPITYFDKDENTAVIADEGRENMNNILDQYGRDPYGRLVSMAKIAQRDGVIKGIMVHQGEKDAYGSEWYTEVSKIYSDLQKDLNLNSEEVPLFVGEVVRTEYGGICGHANSIINGLPRYLPNAYVVSSENCMPGADNLHFCSEGYRELGRHYALCYLEVTNPSLAKVCKQRLGSKTCK